MPRTASQIRRNGGSERIDALDWRWPGSLSKPSMMRLVYDAVDDVNIDVGASDIEATLDSRQQNESYLMQVVAS